MLMRFRSDGWLGRLGLAALVALATVAPSGCLSPTLPLPPPEEPSSIRSVEDGVWGISGTCAAGAEVVVLDEVTGQGEVFIDLDRTGHYYVELHASQCDLASVVQESGGAQSGKTTFVVHAHEEGAPGDNACNP